MNWFRLGILSVCSFTTSILLGVITVYLLTLRGKSRETWFLTGYLMSLFILLLSYAIRYSLFSVAGLATGQVSNLIVFGVVCLVQFAYHYGENLHPRESRVAFVLFLVVATVTWGSLFIRINMPTVYDFKAQYFTYEIGPRISVVVLVGYLWAFVVLLRKTVLFSRRQDAGGNRETRLSYLIEPAGRRALSSRSFALLTLATTMIAILYLLFQTGVISRGTYSFIFNTGSLLICLLIFIVYINNAPHPTSYRIKLVGIPLATIMVTFGIISSALTPYVNGTLSERYRREVELVRAAISSGDSGGVSREVAYVIPVRAASGSFSYVDPSIQEGQISQIETATTVQGLLKERQGLEPRFFYLELDDTSTFFFHYELSYGDQLYLVGFHYDDYRLAVHLFSAKLALIAIGVTLFVVLGFPLIYRRGLLEPLERLLEAVRQVETGNYGEVLPVLSRDEIGQLARGYNRMVEFLRNAEGNFKALAENANDAILILSAEGRVRYANARAAQISGYSPSELRRKHFRDLVHPGELSRVERQFEARMAGRTTPPCYETAVLDRRGETVPIEITGAKTVWHDEPVDVLIIRDIKDRKKAEELLHSQQQQLLRADKLASLGALVAGMAHEISNPNQVVAMNVRLLSDGMPALFTLAESSEEADESVRIGGLAYPDFKEAAETAVSEISDSTLRIDHIVGELKSFVRGGGKGKAEPTDVNQVIRTVVDLSRHFIRRSTESFKLDLAGKIPEITADRTQLEQVVLNLLQNACQALPDKKRGVSVATLYDESAGVVRIEVTDDGIGIPEDHLAQITEPFFTTRRETGGTGLGLSISNRIVRSHGGSLAFRSRVGKGTTATVSLPVVSA
jgi:PAS domain S-box-containing protein